MTDVWIMNCSCLRRQELFLKGMSMVSSYRRKKVNLAKNPEKKRQKLGAGLLLNAALQERNLEERNMNYILDQNRKPFFKQTPGLFFSLSHSGEWALCALSDQQVGADIQLITEFIPRVAERCFSKEDVKHLDQMSGTERNIEFTRLWAERESRVKFFGTWKQTPYLPPVKEYSGPDEVRIAVCTEDSVLSPLFWWEFS